MKKLILVLFCLLHYTMLIAQEDAWVFFKDKPNAQDYIDNPLRMLSQKAIDRRLAQNIAINIQDVPIHEAYYNTVKSSSNITLLAKSKWLNVVHVRGTQTAIKLLKQQHAFITKIEFANKSLNNKLFNEKKRKIVKNLGKLNTNFNYGNAKNQITMLNGDYLHEEGYTGEGIVIAVIDAGFPNVNTMSSFERLRVNNKILGGYNFVTRSSNFYTANSHGTHVLSTIAGYKEGGYVGTAPDASFYLFITEDATEETPLEESLWVEAAEKADSLGVDIINTSLGYYEFDNKSYNYTYEYMDGKTSFIARGAEIGASKGMLIVVAAGNEGNTTWHYITSPADANGVLTVGAVKADKTVASFSSKGFTSDGRIKPDIMAQGENSTIIYYNNDEVINANGTSFATPIITGVIACLWQAFPKKTAKEIKMMIKKSSNNYTTPNENYGYGIPNFKKAFQTLDLEQIANDFTFRVYPNPANNEIYFKNFKNIPRSISIFNLLGKKIGDYNLENDKINVSNLAKGIYIMQIYNFRPLKLIKR